MIFWNTLEIALPNLVIPHARPVCICFKLDSLIFFKGHVWESYVTRLLIANNFQSEWLEARQKTCLDFSSLWVFHSCSLNSLGICIFTETSQLTAKEDPRTFYFIIFVRIVLYQSRYMRCHRSDHYLATSVPLAWWGVQSVALPSYYCARFVWGSPSQGSPH